MLPNVPYNYISIFNSMKACPKVFSLKLRRVKIQEVRNEGLNVRMFISINTGVELSYRVTIVAQMSAPQL